MFGDNGFSLHIFHPVHFFYTDAIPEQLKLHQTQEREVATMKVFRVWFSDLEIQKLSHPLYPRGDLAPNWGTSLLNTSTRIRLFNNGQASSVIPMPAMSPVVCSARAFTTPR